MLKRQVLAQPLIERFHEIGRDKAQGLDDAVYVDVPQEFDLGLAVPLTLSAAPR
jgi:hypothetical protein